jgi:hypothetical protein
MPTRTEDFGTPPLSSRTHYGNGSAAVVSGKLQTTGLTSGQTGIETVDRTASGTLLRTLAKLEMIAVAGGGTDSACGGGVLKYTHGVGGAMNFAGVRATVKYNSLVHSFSVVLDVASAAGALLHNNTYSTPSSYTVAAGAEVQLELEFYLSGTTPKVRGRVWPTLSAQPGYLFDQAVAGAGAPINTMAGVGGVADKAVGAADANTKYRSLLLDGNWQELPDAPTVTVSAITKTTALINASVYNDLNADAQVARQFRVRRTSDDAILYGPVTLAAGTLSTTATGLEPFSDADLVGEARDSDAGGYGSWGTSAAFATLPWDEGTEELIVYEDDDETEWASCSSSSDHARPYVMRPDSWGDAELDLLRGSASIGQHNLRVLDKRTDATDQGSGWFSAKLADAGGNSALIGHRVLRRRFESGAWVTVMDGVIDGVQLDDQKVSYTLVVKDMRERERKVRAFYRTGTSTVLPRGAIGGYGLLPSGEWLIPPSEPITATFHRLDATVGYARTGADRSHPDLRLILTAGMEAAAEPVWVDSLQHQVLDKVTVLWRVAGSGGAYTELVRMPLNERVFWTFRLEPKLFDWVEVEDFNLRNLREGLKGARMVSRVNMSATDTAAIPADGASIELMVRYDGPATEQYPLHYDGTFGGLLAAIYDGTYSTDENGNPFDPRIRYDAAAVAALSTPCHARITEKTDDLRDWVEKHIYQPLGAAPAIVDGLITPVRYALPASDAVLSTLDAAVVSAAGWEHTGSDAVNVAKVTYHRDYALGTEGDPRGDSSAGDGIATREVVIEERNEPSVALLGEKKLEIAPVTLRSLGGAYGTLLTGDVMDESPAQLARALAHQALDRFVLGGQHVTATTTEPLEVGDWALVQLAPLPDYRTLRRSLAADGVNVTERLAQVVSVSRPNPAWRELGLVDAGAVNTPALAPTLGALSSSAAGIVSVPVTAVPAGTTAEVQYAVVAAGGAAPATASGDWLPAGRTDAVATLTTPALPAGMKVWIRARGVVTGERSSLYTVPVAITLAQTARLTDVKLRFADDGTATFTWTPNAYALGARIAYDIHEEGTTASLASSIDADASLGTVDLPDLVPPEWLLTADVTGYTGWSGSAATGTAGETQRVEHPRKLGPWLFALNLTHSPTGTLNAQAEFNEHVDRVEFFSRLGSDPRTAGVPDGGTSRGTIKTAETDTWSWPVRDGTHYVVARGYFGDDQTVYHDRLETIVITGVGGGGTPGVEAPTDVPGTPLVIADGTITGATREVSAAWTNTNDDLDIEYEWILAGVPQGDVGDTPGSTSETGGPFDIGLRVAIRVRYTQGPGYEGAWVTSSAVRITEMV